MITSVAHLIEEGKGVEWVTFLSWELSLGAQCDKSWDENQNDTPGLIHDRNRIAKPQMLGNRFIGAAANGR